MNQRLYNLRGQFICELSNPYKYRCGDQMVIHGIAPISWRRGSGTMYSHTYLIIDFFDWEGVRYLQGKELS